LGRSGEDPWLQTTVAEDLGNERMQGRAFRVTTGRGEWERGTWEAAGYEECGAECGILPVSDGVGVCNAGKLIFMWLIWEGHPGLWTWG